ncbi:MAG: NAD(P)H-dependent oxidoreductase [Deltaproteobacteria bacterium]|jgi:hypothetical protein|nr:NAD(P)H-dependent oxidoreductase [Deltaproteobacteria bacterium]
MKIVILNGSPKGGDSASLRISRALAEAIQKQSRSGQTQPGQGRAGGGEEPALVRLNSWGLRPEDLIASLRDAGALVLVFPLYVDSVPSHLLALMEAVCQGGPRTTPGARLHAVVNNGFWESENNSPAFEVLRHFASESGLAWGQGLGWGGGGMIATCGKIGRHPFKSFGRETDFLAGQILSGGGGPERYCQPNIPRLAYFHAANLSWYVLAWKNKIKFKDLLLRRQPPAPKG